MVFVFTILLFSLPLVSHNHSSAYQNSSFLEAYIQAESQARQISGPCHKPPHFASVSSPFGIIPKKEPGCFRVIHDLSYPKGQSYNDLILREFTSVLYKDFDYVSALALAAGKGCLIA